MPDSDTRPVLSPRRGRVNDCSSYWDVVGPKDMTKEVHMSYEMILGLFCVACAARLYASRRPGPVVVLARGRNTNRRR
jgi:hypothetical protein